MSAYRDDLEAAHARVQALEKELASTRAELALVRHGGSDDRALAKTGDTALARGTVPGSEAMQRWLGGPTQLLFTRIIEGELDDKSYVDLMQCVQRHLNEPGDIRHMPGLFSWSSQVPSQGMTPMAEVHVRSRDGKTEIRAIANLRGTVVGNAGAASALSVFGFLGALALYLSVSTVLGVVAVPVLAGGMYTLSRYSSRTIARSYANKLEACADELAEIAKSYLNARENASDA